ncbi:MAG: hypothetical protein ABJC04_03545 [Verrucomicrobiota bacterium]
MSQIQLVTCSKCRAAIPPDIFNLEPLTPCLSCGNPIGAFIFPALYREQKMVSAERVMLEGEAGCFYHPEKKAILPCESCGRFLCALCDVDLNGQHLCPNCLDTGKKKGKLKSLENRRVLYDRIALTAAIVPMLFIWTTIIGAPIALYVAIRYWKAPGSILGGSKIRFVIAIILASMQILAWLGILVYALVK